MELRLDGARFKKYFRFTPEQFDYIIQLIGPSIYKMDTQLRGANVWTATCTLPLRCVRVELAD